MNEKVYIVDYELLSPIAFGKENLSQNLADNVMGESLVTKFDTSGMPFKVGAEVKPDLEYLYQSEDQKIITACKYDRKLELLVACYHLGKQRFEEICKHVDPTKAGVILGIGSDVTKFALFEEELEDIFENEKEPYKELIALQNNNKGVINTIWNPYDIHAIYIAEKLKLAAFQESTLTACTSSTQAIAFGFDAVKNGSVDLVVCGGTDSIINTLALASFGKLGVIPECDGSDMPTCFPFDFNRKGTLAGEAAGLVIMVSESYLRRYQLTPIAELLSYGNTLDGYKITAPDPEGTAMHKAIKQALDKGGIAPEKIDYIQAHGTATRHNDVIEIDAIKSVFGAAFKDVCISSTKDRHGHAIAAAGIQEFNILLNSMENDFMPANVNLRTSVDETANLIQKNKNKRINYAMTNNFAFGGVNTALLLKNTKK